MTVEDYVNGDRAKIAEALGWLEVSYRMDCQMHSFRHSRDPHKAWWGREPVYGSITHIPDPLNVAEDYDAVETWLLARGWTLEHYAEGTIWSLGLDGGMSTSTIEAMTMPNHSARRRFCACQAMLYDLFLQSLPKVEEMS